MRIAMYAEFVIMVISFFNFASCSASKVQVEPDSSMTVSPLETISAAFVAISIFLS